MEDEYLIPIGKRMGKIRRAQHMTQETLANMLGVTPKHISHTERGTSTLSLKNLIEFCNIFDCSLDYVIFGKSSDKATSKLPAEILEILDHGTETQQYRLNKIFELFIEITRDDPT